MYLTSFSNEKVHRRRSCPTCARCCAPRRRPYLVTRLKLVAFQHLDPAGLQHFPLPSAWPPAPLPKSLPGWLRDSCAPGSLHVRATSRLPSFVASMRGRQRRMYLDAQETVSKHVPAGEATCLSPEPAATIYPSPQQRLTAHSAREAIRDKPQVLTLMETAARGQARPKERQKGKGIRSCEYHEGNKHVQRNGGPRSRREGRYRHAEGTPRRCPSQPREACTLRCFLSPSSGMPPQPTL